MTTIHRLAACAAALGCASAAAQSGVTLYGVVDLALQHSRAGGVGSSTALVSGGHATSRLGLQGTEELGGGLRAGFALEGSLNADTGSGRPSNSNNQASGAGLANGGLTFDRKAYVSLSHERGGELRLGHDFVPSHYSSILFDPFTTVGAARVGNLTFAGVGRGPLYTAITASNAASYWLPKGLGGLYGMAMVARGENPEGLQRQDGNLAGARLGYASGALDVAAAYTRTRYATTATLGNYTHANLGASWNAGFAKFFGLYNLVRVDLLAGQVRKHTLSLGVMVPVSAQGRIRATYARLDDRSDAALRNADGSARSGNDARQLAIGYVHDLSKRTALYGTYAQIRNQGQADYVTSGAFTPLPGRKVSAIELGIRHAF